MDKNIVGYCRYIDLISFVAYRPATASVFGILIEFRSISLHRTKRRAGHATMAGNVSNDRE
jgi:hypothetical protein